jgi:Ca2+-binding EF-hand superfamily protein
MRLSASFLLLALASAPVAAAPAPADYVQRVADEYRAAMQAQDYDHDGVVTREEARTNLLLSGAFGAIDIDGDDRITPEELDRFLGALPDNPGYL